MLERAETARDVIAVGRGISDRHCGGRTAVQLGGIHLLLAAKAAAAFAGRDFVTPDDIQGMAGPTLRHRIILQPEAEANGLNPDDAIRSILQRVPVPR